MNFKILSLFPEVIAPYLSSSILGRAQAAGKIRVDYYNIRDYSKDKHRRVDDTPYGGGYGMVMAPQPVLDCHKAASAGLAGRTCTVYLSPAGRKFNHDMALWFRQSFDNLILLCGHYEGIDQRIIDRVVDQEVSVGDYVLTGGELPCAILVDAISRLIDGVLPDGECYTNESIASGLLEYPQYTKPATYDGAAVPEVLRAGNHADITRWQREQALAKTWRVRPELLNTALLDKDDLLFLEQLRLEALEAPEKKVTT